MNVPPNEKITPAAAALTLLIMLVNALLWTRTALPALPALIPYLTLTSLLCVVVWIRYRFQRLANEERRDRAALEKGNAGNRLFAGSDDPELDPVSYIHAQHQFEKWFVPFLAPLLSLVLIYWSLRLNRGGGLPAGDPEQRLFAASFLIGQAFVLFLFGRYLLGLSRDPADRLLRGPGTLLLLSAFFAVLIGVAAMVSDLGFPAADRWIRHVLTGYLWIPAVEYVLNTIGFLYRPKRKEVWTVTYESRLTALLTDPRSWNTGLSQTLDYQFGFQVSQTGFYRFIRRALLPLVFVQILLLYALSCIVVLGPEEEALLERFGSPYQKDGTPRMLSSGLHLKWPWPFDTVRRYPSRRILTLPIGYELDPDYPHPPLIVWTRPHFLNEEQFIVASRDDAVAAEDTDAVPVNFVTVNVPVEYRIANLHDYAYRHRHPDALLRMAAYRVVTRELAHRDLIELLGDERQAASRRLFEEIQRAADELGLGVEILFAGLHGAHPPIAVAPAFEDVIGAIEEKETAVLEARAYANRTLPMAGAEGDALVWQARADRARRVDIALAEAERFDVRLRIHRALPGIYMQRLYLETLNRALKPVHKYVVATSPDREVIILNLEEKIRPDLFDFGPGLREDRFL